MYHLCFYTLQAMTDINHDGAAALISREFSNLYKNDWHRARESLRETKSEEEIIYILLRIVRVSFKRSNIYEFTFLHHCKGV